MSKMITLSVTIRDDALPIDYIAPLVTEMQDFAKRSGVESVSISCHTLDEEGEITDTIYTATPDPIEL